MQFLLPLSPEFGATGVKSNCALPPSKIIGLIRAVHKLHVTLMQLKTKVSSRCLKMFRTRNTVQPLGTCFLG